MDSENHPVLFELHSLVLLKLNLWETGGSSVNDSALWSQTIGSLIFLPQFGSEVFTKGSWAEGMVTSLQHW